MWCWASNLIKVHRGRRAAVALIAPMVEKSRIRFGLIPEAVWSDPYIVGFVVMLVSIVAKFEVGKIDEKSLCKIQAKAWGDISMRGSLIDTTLTQVSTVHCREFEAGCQDAINFASLASGNSIELVGADVYCGGASLKIALSTGLVEKEGLVAVAWQKFFEENMSAYLPSCGSNESSARSDTSFFAWNFRWL